MFNSKHFNRRIIRPATALLLAALMLITSAAPVFADLIAVVTVGNDRPETGPLTADGVDYSVTVNYGEDAAIPDGALLFADEIAEDSDLYNRYYENALRALNCADGFVFARFFDIRIEQEGGKIEPAAPVEVNITCGGADPDGQQISVVHFP